ncbi:bifunctional diaminohydroxyphosphoribosylaminopyrimidine deaminase/5-amino-6-(5-phosphoribosylamino)uracil reductase RibD [Aestuariimicrobium sp. Y1814]|uniref:bifunctional diaminohydroxyphosphoribosylaminopyrimidine deaminase/5-amino-6-(5-phosphoribosylamino)uracil reductase RibD n=1 Tax=Aestuariimicrobium sp. Y1814 TaxID=3418742 RepID=UPI003DA6E19F
MTAGHPDDECWLRRALELATRSPAPDPNPRVGAVIVRDQVLLGEGWHHGAGTPHAEVEALRAAGDARGATAYVSLEPCNHTGRTAACALALIEAGVSRVVYAQPDPNPVAAGGASTLRQAGIEVAGGLLAEQAEALNRGWSFSVRHGRPRVTWKFASTLDGRSAAADGTSQWITGGAARADVHRLRDGFGAVVVGTGTALADNPRLTVRTDPPPLRQPLRVVVGRRDLPPTANLLDGSVETLQVRSHDPAEVLAACHARGIHEVWLEGGPVLAAAFLRAGLVDEVIAYLAGALLGAGAQAVADLGVGTIDQAHRFSLVDVTRLDDDVRLTLAPRPTEIPRPSEIRRPSGVAHSTDLQEAD